MKGFYFIPVEADRARQLMIAGGVWLGLSAAAIFVFFFNPASPSNQWFPKCPFRLLTGMQCPGCGSTRAFYQLLHLHPIAAFKFNPLMILTLPFIVYGFLGFTRSVDGPSATASFHSTDLSLGLAVPADFLLGLSQYTLVSVCLVALMKRWWPI